MCCGPCRPNLALLSDSVPVLTSPHLDQAWLQTQLVATAVASSTQLCPSHKSLHAGLRNAKMVLLLAWDKALKSLGHRFLLDCS